MKASDIADTRILEVIPIIMRERNLMNLGASRWDIGAKMPEFPEKVVLAKLRSMVKRKLISGCACGCRGDFTVL